VPFCFPSPSFPSWFMPYSAGQKSVDNKGSLQKPRGAITSFIWNVSKSPCQMQRNCQKASSSESLPFCALTANTGRMIEERERSGFPRARTMTEPRSVRASRFIVTAVCICICSFPFWSVLNRWSPHLLALYHIRQSQEVARRSNEPCVETAVSFL
jgi:hypothetical protein